VAPARLAGLLKKLPRVISPDLLVDMETMDDAGVFRVAPGMALVQTLDFFQPVVQDPRHFGRIVAANSLSDVWAMGATPLTAMNILACPAKLPVSAIEELLTGAAEKLQEAGVVLVGGHSMELAEIFYGMSVTGLADPDHILTNAKAQVGDMLILTKALGTAVYSDAHSKGELAAEREAEFIASMERLNMYASRVLVRHRVGALTDVTGFGLLGHALPMARNAGVTVRIDASAVPLFTGALALHEQHVSLQAWKAEQYVGPWLREEGKVPPLLMKLLMEPQTSGGLLAAVRAAEAGQIVRELREAGDLRAAVIGEVEDLHRTDGEVRYLKVR
jgi:selenide, water dikinase